MGSDGSTHQGPRALGDSRSTFPLSSCKRAIHEILPNPSVVASQSNRDLWPPPTARAYDVGYELLKPRRHALVLIDCLEPRRLLSSYVVNTISDAINPGAGLLSLRAAIAKA